MLLDRLSSLKKWQKVLVVFLVIFIPISLSLGWYLFSPVFLPGALGGEEFDTDYIVILSKGEFVRIDSLHYGGGMVQIVQEENMSNFLYFLNVTIANGPALVVYLSDKASFSGTGDNPGNYYDLGALEYTRGNFSILIPSNVNLNDYKSVLIWCRPFSVVFTWATLQPYSV